MQINLDSSSEKWSQWGSAFHLYSLKGPVEGDSSGGKKRQFPLKSMTKWSSFSLEL